MYNLSNTEAGIIKNMIDCSVKIEQFLTEYKIL